MHILRILVTFFIVINLHASFLLQQPNIIDQNDVETLIAEWKTQSKIPGYLSENDYILPGDVQKTLPLLAQRLS